MRNRENERSLIPLLIVTGTVSLPLLFILGIVAGSQIQFGNTLTTDSLSSWISALATAAIAILTFVLAKETWYLREAQIEQVNELRKENIRPNVSTKLTNSKIAFNFMNIEVHNQGKGIAKDVQFKFLDKENNEIKVNDNPAVDYLLKIHIFSSGIHSLGIGQKIESFVFNYSDLGAKLIDKSAKEIFFNIKIIFKDVEGNIYENILTIDFQELDGISTIGGSDPLHKLSGDIEKLRKLFENVTRTTHTRFNVNAYTSNDRKHDRIKDSLWRMQHSKNENMIKLLKFKKTKGRKTRRNYKSGKASISLTQREKPNSDKRRY